MRLPVASHDRRDLWFLLALLAHAPVAAALGFVMSGETWWHITGEAVAPGLVALVAYFAFAGTRAFRVFVALALLVLYYDWLPIVVAAGTVAVHHILLDEIMPHAVFQSGVQSRGIVVLHA